MRPELEGFLAEADKRYLTTEELKVLGRYVVSLPKRLALYRRLRDQELGIFQPVAEQIQAKASQTSESDLEHALQLAILSLRNCAMAMLVQDPSLWQEHLRWFREQQDRYQSQDLDTLLYPLLYAQLQQVLGGDAAKVFKPYLDPLLGAIAPE